MDDQAAAQSSVGFYASILTAVIAAVTLTIAVLTPPLSGPWCNEGCIAYPFTDAISRFPRDYIWMYPAILLAFSYAALMACIHRFAPESKKTPSLIGLAFALMSAAVLAVNYFVQLSVIQPSLINGETEGFALLTQYNSHGIFIALEEIGFFMMGLSFLFMAPVFSGSRLRNSIRFVFAAAFLLVLVSFILISIAYGIGREYRFEIAVITIDWLTLIVSGTLLSFVFKQRSLPAN